VGVIVGLDVGVFEGFGVGAPTRYVGSKVGFIDGSELGDVEGMGVGLPGI